MVTPPVTVQFAASDHKPPLAPVKVTEANCEIVALTVPPVKV